jgi:FkbM family methyltransferase
MFRRINTFLIKNKIIKNNIIDLGAWIGDNSIPWARNVDDRIVYAIDPSPDNCDFINKTCELNKIKNVKIIQSAISNVNEILTTNDDLHHCSFVYENPKKTGINKVYAVSLATGSLATYSLKKNIEKGLKANEEFSELMKTNYISQIDIEKSKNYSLYAKSITFQKKNLLIGQIIEKEKYVFPSSIKIHRYYLSNSDPVMGAILNYWTVLDDPVEADLTYMLNSVLRYEDADNSQRLETDKKKLVWEKIEEEARKKKNLVLLARA